MKLIKMLSPVPFLVLLTVACQFTGVGDSVTNMPTPEYPSNYPPPDLFASPMPTYPGMPYPFSDVSTYPVPTVPSVLYPDTKDGDEVLWNQAVSMILNGEVTQVMQTHDLKVYLTLKDGRTLVTLQPGIDEVIKVIKKCGEKCKDIRIATE